MKKTLPILLLVVVVHLSSIPLGHARWTTVQLTDNDDEDFRVEINDSGNLAWWSGDMFFTEIFFYNGTKIIQLSDNDEIDYLPQINVHGHVVWTGYTGTDYEVFFYDGEETIQITHDDSSCFEPKINNHAQMVWHGRDDFDGENDDEIHFYNGTSIVNLSNNAYDDSKPQINDNGHIVWIGCPDGSNWDVFLYDGTGKQNISSGDDVSNYVYLRLNNHGHAVWQSHPAPYSLFLYNGTTSIKLLDDRKYYSPAPDINNNGQMVWVDRTDTRCEIYRYEYGSEEPPPPQNISNNSYDNLAPRINDNGHVVWQGFDGHDWEIFYHNGATATQITDNCYDDTKPRISLNGHIAWMGFDGNDDEVFLATPMPSGPADTWGATYGSLWSETGGIVRQTYDGGFILSGASRLSADTDPVLLVLKLNSGGHITWQKAYPELSGGSIQQTGDGGYIILAGNRIAKLDASGNLVWQKSYDATFQSIQELGCDGGYILAGGLGAHSGSEPDPGGDLWVARLAADGNIHWQKTYGTEDGGEKAHSIRVTSDGGYIVAGETNSWGAGAADCWILKLNPDGHPDGDGSVAWQKSYGSSHNDPATSIDYATSIDQTSDGGYIVAGTSTTLPDPTFEVVYVWVLKLNTAGDISWQKTFGNNAGSYVSVIHQTSDSGYVLAGNDGLVILPNDPVKAWALKLDAGGSILWQKAYDGPIWQNRDIAESIQETLDGGFVMGGSTDSSGMGENDLFILKLDDNGEAGDCLPLKTHNFHQTDLAAGDVVIVETTATPETTDVEVAPETSEVVSVTVFRGDPCGPLVVEGAIDLPVTGQTECYGTNTADGVIDCEGTGQDGEHQMGVAWPEPRFTANDEEETITDHLTGLLWAQDAGMPTLGDGACTGGGLTFSGKPWQDALDYIDCLNHGIGSTDFDGDYLGYDDWRLPNQHELFSLINVSYYDTTYNNSHWLWEQGFSSFIGSYWSSTTAVPYWDGYIMQNGDAWMVDSGQGNESPSEKATHYRQYTPVRSSVESPAAVPLPKTGQTSCYEYDEMDDMLIAIECDGTGQDGEFENGVVWPAPRFILNSDASVTDRLTGLIWAADARASEGSAGGECEDCLYNAYAPSANWQQALDYVICLNGLNEGAGHLGHNDWRLPNVYELRSLIDFSQNEPALPAGHPFSNINTSLYRGGYWTSTTHHGSGAVSKAWFIDFGDRGERRADSNTKTNLRSVWPVRGGKKVTSSWDLDGDGDVDGSDLSLFADGYINGTFGMGDVEGFGWAFGRSH